MVFCRYSLSSWGRSLFLVHWGLLSWQSIILKQKEEEKNILWEIHENSSDLFWMFMLGIIFSSVGQLCPTLGNPMDHSTPGFPVHYQLLELIQTHVHRVGDAIQPSHPLLSPSSAFNLFPASGSFQMSQFSTSGGQSIEFQHQSFQWIFRTDFL